MSQEPPGEVEGLGVCGCGDVGVCVCVGLWGVAGEEDDGEEPELSAGLTYQDSQSDLL